MENLEQKIMEWLKAENPSKCDNVQTQEEVTELSEEIFDNKKNSVDDLPIYTATTAEINLWHGFGSKCELQTLLQKYDLGFGGRDHAYDKFKVGYNKEEHYASFAIDETHYYKIQFTEYDGEPIDRQAAKKVLEKINAMRGEK